MAPPVLRVALLAPIDTLFDYLPPSGVAEADLRPGVRVRVPFGRGLRIGLLSALAERSSLPRARLRPVEQLLDPAPLLTDTDLEFLSWAAAYYHHPIGEVLLSALPARLRRGEAQRSLTASGWQLTEAGRGAIEQGAARRAPRQTALLAAVAAAGGRVTDAQLRLELGECRAALSALGEKGWLSRCELRTPPAVTEKPPVPVALELNPAQQQAVAGITEGLGRFAVHLLEGVTGSGKTEVYVRVARAVTAARRHGPGTGAGDRPDAAAAAPFPPRRGGRRRRAALRSQRQRTRARLATGPIGATRGTGRHSFGGARPDAASRPGDRR